MLDVSIRDSETEHSSPKEIICHQRMEELANPPLSSLLLLRARGVASLLLCDLSGILSVFLQHTESLITMH